MKSFILAIVLGTAVYYTAVDTNFIGNLVETKEHQYVSPIKDESREEFLTSHSD